MEPRVERKIRRRGRKPAGLIALQTITKVSMVWGPLGIWTAHCTYVNTEDIFMTACLVLSAGIALAIAFWYLWFEKNYIDAEWHI